MCAERNTETMQVDCHRILASCQKMLAIPAILDGISSARCETANGMPLNPELPI